MIRSSTISSESDVDCDDIIAVQEPSQHYGDMRAPMLIDDSRSHYTQSQDRQSWKSPRENNPQTEQPRQLKQERRQRRRRDVADAVLAASQEAKLDADATIEDSSNRCNNRLSSGGAFASLESLLDQQSLSSSMTQDEDMDDPDPASYKQTANIDMQFERDRADDNNFIRSTEMEIQTGLPKGDAANNTVISIVTEPNTFSDDPSFRARHQYDTSHSENSSPRDFHCQQVLVCGEESAHIRSEMQQGSSKPSSARPRKSLSARRRKTSLKPMEDYSIGPTNDLRQRLEREKQKQINQRRQKSPRSLSTDISNRENSRPSKKTLRSSRSASSTSSGKSVVTTPPKRKSSIEPSKKSLLGFRPSHWDRDGSCTSMRPSNGNVLNCLDSLPCVKNRRQSDNDKHHKDLIAACSKPNIFMCPPPPRRPSLASWGPQRGAFETTSPLYRTNLSTSFKPDFLARVGKQQSNNDRMDINDFEDVEFSDATLGKNDSTDSSILALTRANNKAASKKRRNFSSYLKPMESRKPLTRLLHEVQTEQRADETRLRSGEYPFPTSGSSRFDLYNPRNRAVSYVDVTLLGESFVPCQSQTAKSRSRQISSNNKTILGYIHNHRIFPDRDILASLDQPTMTPTNCFAWVCFSSDTIQEHNLLKATPRGYQLRIYDPIVLSNASASPATDHVVMLCTQLCENNAFGILEPSVSELLERVQSKGSN